MARLELRGCTLGELKSLCQELGMKSFRGQQVFQWVQNKGVTSWSDMKNISEKDRERLMTVLDLSPLVLLDQVVSRDGTRKYLFRLKDGETIECVLMGYERAKNRDRRTICVSTQVGCAVGCAFCATGLGGFKRNLTAGEIVSQVLDITRLMRQEDSEFQVTNVVFMGMGEPLLNYEAVLKGIDILNAQEGQNIGMRRMTISTSGVVPKIYQLARDNPQVGLAVSLHSPEDEERNKLVPINRKYPLSELMEACRAYSDLTHRRITFEVALIRDKTTEAFAIKLAQLLKGQLAHVNLIPVNPVSETGMMRPTTDQIKMVENVLQRSGISVSVREERGTDIDAACGQLRRRWECD